MLHVQQFMRLHYRYQAIGQQSEIWACFVKRQPSLGGSLLVIDLEAEMVTFTCVSAFRSRLFQRSITASQMHSWLCRRKMFYADTLSCVLKVRPLIDSHLGLKQTAGC